MQPIIEVDSPRLQLYLLLSFFVLEMIFLQPSNILTLDEILGSFSSISLICFVSVTEAPRCIIFTHVPLCSFSQVCISCLRSYQTRLYSQFNDPMRKRKIQSEKAKRSTYTGILDVRARCQFFSLSAFIPENQKLFFCSANSGRFIEFFSRFSFSPWRYIINIFFFHRLDVNVLVICGFVFKENNV